MVPKPDFLQADLPEPPAAVATPAPWTETVMVGTRQPRVDACERLSGSAVFPLDIILPGMLHGAILRCPHAHALVKSVDLSPAMALPGIRAAISGQAPDAAIPWYNGSSTLFDSHCRYEGEEVAAVAADTPQQARDALRAIKVEYEPLPFVSTMEEALRPGAPELAAGGNAGPPATYSRGDVEKGFAEADGVLEETYSTNFEIHTPMEVHGSVANWEGNRLTVWDTTQGVFMVQATVAKALQMPLSRVRVIGHYMGGGFGSKLETGKYTIIAALLARRTGRPVKLFLSREEAFRCTGNRPANTMTIKAGVKRDGTLTALQINATGSSGAYRSGSGVGFQVTELYRCPNVKREERDILINAGQARPFRAPGFPQCSWALEQMMDALAAKIGMDPVEFRLKNIPENSQVRNLPLTSSGLARCLAEGAKAFGWEQARKPGEVTGHLRRGSGVAACLWGYPGGPPSTAIVKLFADGSVNLNMGASDIGTGTKTVMAMVVAEELGVALDRIQIEHADTATTQFATPSGGSKTVPSDSPAVRMAALAVKQQILELAAEELKLPPEDLVLRGGQVEARLDPSRKMDITAIKTLQQRGLLLGTGYREPNPAGKAIYPFAVHFAEVEVNLRTGEVKVLRMLAAHDSGRIMNRLTCDNQVRGGIVMGIGFGMTERRVLDRGQTGKMVNANWHSYKIPTMLDAPLAIDTLFIDPADRECNSCGAKGIGEPATIPAAAAIANAFFHATGIRVLQPPLNPTMVLDLLERTGRKE